MSLSLKLVGLALVGILHWLRGKIGLGPPLSKGAAGERQAEEFLKKLGYRVLARNWRNPQDLRDELDLVCSDGEIVVFVEVKARSEGALVSGYHAIDRRKRKVLRRTARAYLKALSPERRPETFRLDVVEISMGLGAGALEVRHFENVPLFTKYDRA